MPTPDWKMIPPFLIFYGHEKHPRHWLERLKRTAGTRSLIVNAIRIQVQTSHHY